MSVLIAGALILFAIRYRRGASPDRTNPPEGSLALEVIWSLIPLVTVMVIFAWGASVYFRIARAPDDAMTINVVGKRWMWKLQHANGRREINELHVPVGQAVRLTMTSEDVIHSFFVPAFRVKQDVLPGRYTSVWFEATRAGRYHLFCAEYCGTKHSRMIGSVVVMEPDEFQAWLGGEQAGLTPAAVGERLFFEMGCASCHSGTSGSRGPALDGLMGSTVLLERDQTVIADEEYVRESILDPMARVVRGYSPLMPTFKGLIGEEGLFQIMEYLKTLEKKGNAVPGAPAAAAAIGAPVAEERK
jgi:cytochrome c oxidase subunit 2